MPRFHTKTIESILDPVAQQVSQLVILHEEAEDGNAMPDLAGPVQTVSAAVTNLSQVGKETIYISKDEILKEDMPPTLTRVEDACLLLVEASRLLKSDPFSAQARKKLIEGSRGILQGTSGLLLCFDESEVRKIVRCCKNVLEYLAVTEVVESMEDLVTFVKKLTPGLTDMTKQVDAREKELTHQVHREMLQRSIATVKQLIPVLISAIKIFVSTNSQGMPGLKEAQENRDYTVRVMSDEIQEIIRVLQLTTYDEDEWDADDIMVMKKARNAIEGRMKQAKDWLQDPRGVVGGVGERSLRQILEDAMKVAERCNNPAEAEAIKKQVGDIQSMVDSLAELRSQGLGDSPAAVALARGIQQKMDDLQDRVDHAVAQTEKAGLIKAAHTMDGRVEQAQRWLANPGADKGLGEQATRAVIAEGRKVANTLQGPERNEVLRLCDDVEQLTNELADLCRRGMGNTPQAKAIARNLSGKLQELKNKIQGAVMKKVADDFMDITTPLKELSKAALAPPDTPNRNPNFQEKARAFEDHGYRLVDTSKMLAATGDCCNKKVVEGIINASDQLNSQIPQIVNAASIVLSNPGNKGAEDHFELMKKEYVDNVEKLKNMVDVATDSAAFIKANEDAILYETERVEHAIKGRNPAAIVQNTSSIARRAQRVVQVAKMEAENSEDPLFVQNVESSLKNLESTVTPMVIAARNVSMNPADGAAAQQWRSANDQLINGVRNVRKAVTPKEELPPPPPLFEEDFPAPPDLSGLNLQDVLDSLCNASPPCNFPDSVRIPVSPKSARHPVSPHSSPMTQRHSRLSPTSTQQHPTTQLQVHLQPAAPPPPAPVQPPVPAPPVPPPPGDYFRDVPPRPPLPQESAPPRPPPPEEQEAAVLFKQQPKENQPIMVAAHALHQEVKQWESNDNELIAAAKKMALLMAKLSQLVRGEGGAKSKKELIATAKAIAAASEEVTRLANDLARQCTDKRMRTNLWQVCERIPTIGTQLKILSTVKATMLGAQGSDEDQEATEMLVGNAQNLMQSVRETVRAAEAASIKIRVDSGYTLKWVRMKPWYTS